LADKNAVGVGDQEKILSEKEIQEKIIRELYEIQDVDSERKDKDRQMPRPRRGLWTFGSPINKKPVAQFFNINRWPQGLGHPNGPLHGGRSGGGGALADYDGAEESRRGRKRKIDDDDDDFFSLKKRKIDELGGGIRFQRADVYRKMYYDIDDARIDDGTPEGKSLFALFTRRRKLERIVTDILTSVAIIGRRPRRSGWFTKMAESLFRRGPTKEKPIRLPAPNIIPKSRPPHRR
jgi:hypothetical protein